MRFWNMNIIVYFGSIFFFTSTCFAIDFPYRDKYPDVKTIELSDLKSGYDSGEFIVIDIRSPAEYETIHIKNALSIPYGHANFTRDLNRIAKANRKNKIAVYDNGIDCIKSYKAAEDAFLFAMIQNIYAFDAGIVTWALAYPAETLLFGNEMKDPKNQLISEEQFNHKNLDFPQFMKLAKSPDAVVLDLRDPIQRKKELPGLENAYHISIEKLINNIISKERMKDKRLFIFDQEGRTVKWLMYYFTKYNYMNFYFLDGGATAVLKEQDYRIVSTH